MSCHEPFFNTERIPFRLLDFWDWRHYRMSDRALSFKPESHFNFKRKLTILICFERFDQNAFWLLFFFFQSFSSNFWFQSVLKSFQWKQPLCWGSLRTLGHDRREPAKCGKFQLETLEKGVFVDYASSCRSQLFCLSCTGLVDLVQLSKLQNQLLCEPLFESWISGFAGRCVA